MLNSLMKSVRKTVKLTNCQLRFSGDWAKDREKAAEKEFMMKEEKEKMKKLRNRRESENQEARFETISDDSENITEILNDREYLVVL